MDSLMIGFNVVFAVVCKIFKVFCLPAQENINRSSDVSVNSPKCSLNLVKSIFPSVKI